MASSSETQVGKEQDKCREIVQSVLDGKVTLEEAKSDMEDCDKADKLEEIIKDCLKNKVEKKCCPDKIVQELKLKIGIATLVLIGVVIKAKVIQELISVS